MESPLPNAPIWRNNGGNNNKTANSMQNDSSSLAKHAFGNTAEAGLIVAYQSHQDALRFLSGALGQSNGAALLLGPKGSGKSTIIAEQVAWSSRDASVAHVDGVRLTPRLLLTAMLSQFDVRYSDQQDDQLLQRLNNFLTQQTREGRTPILIIDNADRATPSALRLLNWLSALEAGGSYALRMIVTGKEKLTSLLRSDSMRSFSRRHPGVYSLNPLTVRETMIYLRTRFIAAGGVQSENVFPVEVCEKLHELSGGWPGVLNTRAMEVIEHTAELQSARQRPRITVSKDGEILGRYELTEKLYVIGRTELADIVIEDSYVSKMHAMLQVYSNAIVMLDLNSTNGTTVNSKITMKSLLRNDDIISLGHYRLKVENVPAIDSEMDERIKGTDTITMQNLEDMRRTRARRTIKALKHRDA